MTQQTHTTVWTIFTYRNKEKKICVESSSQPHNPQSRHTQTHNVRIEAQHHHSPRLSSTSPHHKRSHVAKHTCVLFSSRGLRTAAWSDATRHQHGPGKARPMTRNDEKRREALPPSLGQPSLSFRRARRSDSWFTSEASCRRSLQSSCPASFCLALLTEPNMRPWNQTSRSRCHV
jgi:hypothetical protein